jgi:hypothetical protein
VSAWTAKTMSSDQRGRGSLPAPFCSAGHRPSPVTVSSDMETVCNFGAQYLLMFVIDSAGCRGARNVRLSCCQTGTRQLWTRTVAAIITTLTIKSQP